MKLKRSFAHFATGVFFQAKLLWITAIQLARYAGFFTVGAILCLVVLKIGQLVLG